ncbi:hypothetical protein MA16_Dca013621 [Dendrobium catenatum]|uniref:Uncharacterized protein n=1 Tax=Dendrobium catenatum TaxID=906689 RepID=A0A2I0VUV9_9ASPA|nr:hypothetical protein MA16_Dca013621 [Dendrobium catenatum]
MKKVFVPKIVVSNSNKVGELASDHREANEILGIPEVKKTDNSGIISTEAEGVIEIIVEVKDSVATPNKFFVLTDLEDLKEKETEAIKVHENEGFEEGEIRESAPVTREGPNQHSADSQIIVKTCPESTSCEKGIHSNEKKSKLLKELKSLGSGNVIPHNRKGGSEKTKKVDHRHFQPVSMIVPRSSGSLRSSDRKSNGIVIREGGKPLSHQENVEGKGKNVIMDELDARVDTIVEDLPGLMNVESSASQNLVLRVRNFSEVLDAQKVSNMGDGSVSLETRKEDIVKNMGEVVEAWTKPKPIKITFDRDLMEFSKDGVAKDVQLEEVQEKVQDECNGNKVDEVSGKDAVTGMFEQSTNRFAVLVEENEEELLGKAVSNDKVVDKGSELLEPEVNIDMNYGSEDIKVKLAKELKSLGPINSEKKKRNGRLNPNSGGRSSIPC